MKKYFIIFLFFNLSLSNAQFTNLHNFNTYGGGYSSLTYLNGKLYGTVNNGGTNNSGYIYSLNTDGSGFNILYNFLNISYPCGSLLYDNGVFYGMASQGNRCIYKINIDGSGFNVIHNFTYMNPNDGYYPLGSLIISGNFLYGMTKTGGAVFSSENGGLGTIFKINKDGTNFKVMHSFDYGEEYPYDSLVLSGEFLFGMTSTDLSNANGGKIFKINKNGIGYEILHTFSGGSDGSMPNGNFILSGNTLYGMTIFGGNLYHNSSASFGRGNVFKIDTDGTRVQKYI